MINLDPNILIRIKSDYSNKMLNSIEQRYKQEVSIKPIQENPFTNQPYTNLFENGRVHGIDLKLAEELLTKPMDHLCHNYAQINYYILTCKLVYFSTFKVDKELNRLNKKITQKERNKFREEYVSSYMNPWISSILATHPNFSSNNDNFIALIKEVERRLICLNNAIAKVVDYDFLSSELRHLVLTGTGVEVYVLIVIGSILHRIKREQKLNRLQTLITFSQNLFFSCYLCLCLTLFLLVKYVIPDLS
ncbi:hypothetical protein [Fictibacillus sp. 18YEL24]|uniref:hypothetical protein n=1 Tax=Fictibacillus sp. 18YEL24 TaxID=2745875 RepID=UPI0018CD03D4|nr:hypothetical protein [Fictibacillus sp. 18YEL24]MBH0171651.1 hypothetical protein [Fictibacillus sp. 18YEL24]